MRRYGMGIVEWGKYLLFDAGEAPFDDVLGDVGTRPMLYIYGYSLDHTIQVERRTA
jgi:hypothetical protein